MTASITEGLYAGVWLFAVSLGSVGCAIIVAIAAAVLREAIDTINWHYIMKRRKKDRH